MEVRKVTGVLMLLLSLSIVSINGAFAGEGQWRGVDYGSGGAESHHDNSPRSHYPIIDYANGDSEGDTSSADDTSDESETRTPCVQNRRCQPTCIDTSGNRRCNKSSAHKRLPPQK